MTVPRYTKYPVTPVEVLASQFSATECDDSTAPVPDTETVVGEPVALLAIETFPPTAPDAVGANVTLRTAV